MRTVKLAALALLLSTLACSTVHAQAWHLSSGFQTKPRSTSPGKDTANAAVWFHSTVGTLTLTIPAGTIYSIPSGAVSAKGDMLIYGGSAWQKLVAGANGHVLTLDSSTASGVKWAAGGGGGGSGTFATTYSNTPADNVITANATGLGLFINDDSTPLVSSIFAVRNNAGTSAFLSVNSTGTYMRGTSATNYWFWDSAANTASVFNPSVTTSVTDGVVLSNPTAATAGNQKWSPALSLIGRGWKTDATAASRTVKYSLTAVPIEGTANPTGELRITESINGGGHSTLLQMGSSAITFAPPVTLANSIKPSIDNTIDLGDATHRYRTGYILGLDGGFGQSLQLNAALANTVITSIDNSARLTVSNTAITAAVPFVLTGTQTGTYTLGGTVTVASPVFSGTATGTWNIGGTPTATSPILASLGNAVVASSWTGLSYTNSWTDYGSGGYLGSAYRKDATGTVHVRLHTKNTGSGGTAIGTLPQYFRPGSNLLVGGVGTNAGTYGFITVNATTGVITPGDVDYSGKFFYFSFPAEN